MHRVLFISIRTEAQPGSRRDIGGTTNKRKKKPKETHSTILEAYYIRDTHE